MTAIDFTAFVDKLARAAGDAVLPFFRTSLSVEKKSRGGGFDPVTAADRAAEQTMRTMIRANFPEHPGIVGEEFGNELTDAEYVLGARPDRRHQVLDFRHAGVGNPDRADAARRAGLRPDASAVHPRALQRRLRRGALSRPRRRARAARAALRLAQRGDPDDDQSAADGRRRARRIRPRREDVRLSRYGGDCYAYCMVAAGHVDLVIEAGLKPYDVVPLIPIIAGAGGIITTWDGGPAKKAGGSSQRATSVSTPKRWRC